MRTLTDLNRLPISMKRSMVREVLPEYFVSEYPNLITFLDEYYEFMDSGDEFGSLIQDLYTIRDVEDASLKNIDNMFKELALGISRTQFVTPRDVLRNFATFFRVKGTKYSAEHFFRAFFNEDIEIEYPKDNVFIVGQSEIGVESLKYIQDGDLYQFLSVLVKSPISFATWGNLYRKFVHPGGFYLGAEVQILDVGNSLLTAPLVKLDSDAGEITVETVITFGVVEGDADHSIIQTMGATSYITTYDSTGAHLIINRQGLLETDSSYDVRNHDSDQEIFTVRLQPNMQIRDIMNMTIDSANQTYSSIYDLAKTVDDWPYYPPS
jgi:hypothetical protein